MADEDFPKLPPGSEAPDTGEDAPIPTEHVEGTPVPSVNGRRTVPGAVPAPAHRLSRTAQSALSPFARADRDDGTRTSLDVNTTQESVAIDAAEVDRHYFLERRIVVLEEETAQLNARIRLAEKSVEEARRLAMAASVFAVGAMIVAKLMGR
jgi:hypothetical protein